jgi:tRNA pseudouridine38-40 synthase
VFPHWEGLAVAGRTDTGVHAMGQVASVEVEGGPPLERVAEALNAVLPPDVAVVAAETAPAGFHARFSAFARSYRYIVLTRRTRAPLQARRSLWWPRRLDEASLAAAAALLHGEHDFRAFTPTETQHEVFRRAVEAAAWERRGDELHFTITADSFLRHMVRTLVGTMLERGADGLPALLEGGDRSEAGLTAPAWGLYLEHVRYR